VFGVRLPRALAAAFIDNALRASEGISGLSAAHARSDCCTDCRHDGGRRDRRGHEAHDEGLRGLPPVNDLIAQKAPILLERDNASARLISIRSANETAASHHGAR
jgi:hypothetical protein